MERNEDKNIRSADATILSNKNIAVSTDTITSQYYTTTIEGEVAINNLLLQLSISISFFLYSQHCGNA
jgi:hypothetical protein